MRTFIPNNLDVGFKKWAEHGLTYIHQLFNDNNVKTFEQLKRILGSPKQISSNTSQLRT